MSQYQPSIEDFFTSEYFDTHRAPRQVSIRPRGRPSLEELREEEEMKAYKQQLEKQENEKKIRKQRRLDRFPIQPIYFHSLSEYLDYGEQHDISLVDLNLMRDRGELVILRPGEKEPQPISKPKEIGYKKPKIEKIPPIKQKQIEFRKVQELLVKYKNQLDTLNFDFSSIKKWSSKGSNTEYWKNIRTTIMNTLLTLNDKQTPDTLSIDDEKQVDEKIIEITNLLRSGLNKQEVTVIDFSAIQISKLLKNIPYPDGQERILKLYIHFRKPDGSTQKRGITFNPKFVEDLINYVSSGGEMVENEEYYKSVIDDIIDAYQLTFELIVKGAHKNIKQRKSGGFYGKTHGLDIDLSILQLYRTIDNEIDKNIDLSEINNEKLKEIMSKKDLGIINCFIHCLKYYGFNDNDLIKVGKFINNGYIPKSKLQKIAELLGITIKLKYPLKADKNKSETITYNGGNRKLIHIGLIERHYLPIIPIDITSFAVNNYDLIKHYPKWWEIVGWKNKEHTRVKRQKGRQITSYELVELLEKNAEKLLTPIPMIDIMKYHVFELDTDNIKPEESESKECEYKEKNKSYSSYSGFDTESSPFGIHEDFSGNLTFYNPETGKIGESYSKSGNGYILELFGKLPDNKIKYVPIIGEKYLDQKTGKLKQKMTKKILAHLVLVHNLKYDMSFIMKYLTRVETIIKTNGKTLCVIGYIGNKYIEFRDTYGVIEKPLEKFGEIFKIPQEKEVFPYNAYTKTTIHQRHMRIQTALKNLKPKQHEQFLENIKKLDLINKNNPSLFDHIAYCQYYCQRDVEVMLMGYFKFREWILNELKLDILNYLSAASLAHDYFKSVGCYDNLFELDGITREYIQKCVVGGRCMLRYNEKQDIQIDIPNMPEFGNDLTKRVIKEYVAYITSFYPSITINQITEQLIKKYPQNDKKQLKSIIRDIIHKLINNGKIHTLDLIQDFDACSLYPSAMKRLGEIGGYLKGKPKILTDEQKTYTFLKNQDGYFIKINLKQMGKKRAFPAISKVYDNKRNWVNNITGELFIDKITLEDLIQFHEINENDFNIIDGYYYNQGRNNTIFEKIQQIYSLRSQYKKQKNPIQEVYKLIMNAAYGKTILKPIKTSFSIVDTTEDLDRKILTNHDSIREFVPIEGTDKHIIKSSRSVDNHYTLPQVGVEILSMSKRIMNEVMCTAEDIGCEIYYQDTDSIRIKQSDIDKLQIEYKNKYKRDLIGKEMGQFHNDYPNSENGLEASGATRFIGCAKKLYYNKVIYIDSKNNKIDSEDHFCSKGINKKIIPLHAKDNNTTVENTFEKIHKGVEMKFDLAMYQAQGVCSFAFDKSGRVSSRASFVRTINKPKPIKT